MMRPRFYFLTTDYISPSTYSILLMWTIVNMVLDKIWRFSQVHGATPLARLLSGRQQLAGHASLCGLNVKSSVRCCGQPYQLSSSFRSLCFHGNLKCWAKFVVACSWCSARPVPAQSWNNLQVWCLCSFSEGMPPFNHFPNWVGMNRPSHYQIIHPCFVMGKKTPKTVNITSSSNQETVQVLET